MNKIQAENALAKHGYSLESVSRSQAAYAWGVTRDKARHWLSKFRQGGIDIVPPKMVKAESVKTTQDSLVYEIPNTRIHTQEQLEQAFKIDLDKWECVDFTANKWEVAAKDPSGKLVVEPLFQVKAIFKKRKLDNLELVAAEINRLKQISKSEIKPFNINVKYPRVQGIALEVSIADIHIAKLAWGGETGHADYDSKISAGLYEKAFTSLVGRPGYPIQKMCLVVGNDFLNADGNLLQTANGTPQSNDSRYPKMFKTAFDLQVKQIRTALEIAPVEVVVCPGNHDRQSVWHLGHSLECLFQNTKHITIDNAPKVRKYWKYGNNLVMMTHGDTPGGSEKKKGQSLFSIMPLEAPADFVDSRYKEIHLGHLHQMRETNVERTGVRMRVIPSLTAPDFWHYHNGFVGNVRAAQAFEWSQFEGLLGIREFSVDQDYQ